MLSADSRFAWAALAILGLDGLLGLLGLPRESSTDPFQQTWSMASNVFQKSRLRLFEELQRALRVRLVHVGLVYAFPVPVDAGLQRADLFLQPHVLRGQVFFNRWPHSK